MSPTRKLAQVECAPEVQLSCREHMAALEQAVGRLQQSNAELAEAVQEATAESRRRSAALDDLASKLLASDNGLKLHKEG